MTPVWSGRGEVQAKIRERSKKERKNRKRKEQQNGVAKTTKR